jgi:hypothetical protein
MPLPICIASQFSARNIPKYNCLPRAICRRGFVLLFVPIMDRTITLSSRIDRPLFARAVGIALIIGLAGALGWKVAGLLQKAFSLLPYPYELVYGEGTVLHESLLMQSGTNIYQWPLSTGFIAGNYTPVYYFLNSLFVSAGNPTFLSGRVISFVSGLLIAVIVGLIVYRTRRDIPAALTAGLLFLCLTQVNQWFVFFKPDLLALLFTALGVFFITRGGKWVYAAVPFFLLAFYTKQSMAVAPLAAAAYLLVTNRDRRSIYFTAMMAFGVVVPLVIGDLLTAHALYIHLVSFNRRDWSLALFIELTARYVDLYRYELIAAAGLIAFQIKERRLSFPALYLIAACLTMIASGSAGSARNYTLEAGLAGCIAAGIVLQKLSASRSMVGLAGLFLAIAMLGLQVQMIYAMPQRLLGRELPPASATHRMTGVDKLIRQSPDPVLSENIGLLVTNKKQVLYNDPYLMTQLAKSGKWNEQELIDRIKAKVFPFIVLDYDIFADTGPQVRWSAVTVQAIRDNYKLLYRDVMFVYVPINGS